MKKIFLFLMMASLVGAYSCKNANSNAADNSQDQEEVVATSLEEATNEEKINPAGELQEALVKITTDYGVMTVKLYNETPLHRDNFIKLTETGFYDSLLFHRVIKGFMIQGGDPNSKHAPAGQPLGQGGPGYTIPAEIKPNLFHKKGALSAARLGDAMNPSKASSGSQFYVVQGKPYTSEELAMMERQGYRPTPEQRSAYTTVGGTPHLDNGYTVFGEVVEGLEVIDAIANVQTAPGDRPVKDVRMQIELIRHFNKSE